MKRYLLLLFCLCFTVWGVHNQTLDKDSLGLTIQTPAPNSYVLFINCHLESVNWKNNFQDEIISYLNKHDKTPVYIEQVKTLELTDTSKVDSIQKLILKKYPNRPRCVVYNGPAAPALFADVLNKRWKDVPMLYLSANSQQGDQAGWIQQRETLYGKSQKVDFEQLQKQYNITGILTDPDIKGTIDLMQQVIQGMNHLVFISDMRAASLSIRQEVQKILSTYYPNMDVVFLTPERCTTEQLLKQVGDYDKTTGVLFFCWYLNGTTPEDYYISNNLYKILPGFSSVPVFSLRDMNTADGTLVGGHYVLNKDYSAGAIELLSKILVSQNARVLPFQQVDKAHDYLNYYNLSLSHNNNIVYPVSAVYYKKPANFFYVHRYLFAGIALLLFLFISYIVYRFLLMRKTQLLQRAQIETQKELQKEIALRNFKLALSLEVSTVEPWLYVIDTKNFLFDDIKQIVANPQNVNVGQSFSCEDVFSWMEGEHVAVMQNAFKSLYDGTVPYVRGEVKMKRPTESEENWYILQVIVYERDRLGKPLSLMGTFMRITESKKIELQLRDAKQKAEESNRLKSAFLANMSHEIRTPLNAIVGFSGIIAKSNDDEEKRELASIIDYNNSLLLKLINDILDMSKIESGVVDFVENYVDVNQLIDLLKQNYLTRMPRTVELIVEEDLTECCMLSDGPRIRQVLDNFMSNAVKFTKKGTIRLGYYTPQEGRIRFYVKDTGCGIPSNKLQSVFGRFIKLNTFEQGSGLGLSICQMIAENMQGKVGVFSAVNEGSEFWFELPYKATTKKDVQPEEVDTTEQSKRIILIAEDDESNFIVLRSMLGRDYQLLHAWNGEEAVSLFKQYNPSLILMDIRMPIKDGYEATAEIRKISTIVPIIAITSYTFDNERLKVLKNGFTAYEMKPLNRNVIKSKIMKMLHD